MREPLRARISRWLRARTQKHSRIDPDDFERTCLEDPEAALHALSADLKDVREEYDRVASAYRRAVAHLEERVEQAAPADAMREGRQIREVAEGLRRAALRLESSFRETRELESELHEWESRAGEPGERTTDHPDVRAEILRSELALRRDRGMLAAIPLDQSPFRAIALNAVGASADDDASESAEMLDLGEGIEGPAFPDAEHLLLTIKQKTRDVERWYEHADVSPEVCDDVRDLRALHAALRRIDREDGATRDRVAYALRMR